ncbi:hypothetical protein GCM10019016_024580 [Streptomyces prasinosporus]|uniref:Uncharacterized protein n=1 Tax=Streptomyces prasinosporus TaxID=68256 RepID=A0ABP6TLF7_9ACTN|nr:hypothetical protein GCM10010332_27860 [Streptomyces albogriseolus]
MAGASFASDRFRLGRPAGSTAHRAVRGHGSHGHRRDRVVRSDSAGLALDRDGPPPRAKEDDARVRRGGGARALCGPRDGTADHV